MASGYKADGSFAGKTFKKGFIPWNKGKKVPQASGKFHHKYWLGKKFSEEHKKKIGIKSKGNKSTLGKTGSQANHWKGGLTKISYRERRNFQRTIQKQVFIRDNYTCQLCGVRGVDLQVDHIQSWADYIEGRFDINNCRTLCAKCHYRLTFGREMPQNIKGWGHNLLERVRITT